MDNSIPHTSRYNAMTELYSFEAAPADASPAVEQAVARPRVGKIAEGEFISRLAK